MYKKRYNTKKLREIQKIISRDINLKDPFQKDEIKTVAAFDIAIHEHNMVCAVVVMSFPDLKVLEKKYLCKTEPMPYVPTFMAFREGPLILELYHELEYDPDIIMIDGHGIAHLYKCGLASYVGHELSKPTIGIGKGIPQGGNIYQEDKIVIREEIRGFLLHTRQHAKPLFVSPGHMISRETAFDIAKNCARPPHKLPEPLHVAHRFAEKMKKVLFKQKNKKETVCEESKELIDEVKAEEFLKIKTFD